MLCVADYLDALAWIDSIGGLSAAIARSEANLAIIEEFVEKTSWLSFLARNPTTVSNTSVCLSLDASPEQVKEILKLLEIERLPSISVLIEMLRRV
jgi:phosphoserine aminotransferase